MSRVTAPVSKLTRALGSVPAARSSPLLDSTAHAHNAGAVLMPKYAELLRSRSSEHADSSRGLTTTHRPTPQPSLANRSKPLMQTFSSSAAASAVAANHLDAAVLPFVGDVVLPEGTPRVPILPGNFGAAAYADAELAAAPVFPAILAADPDNVLPSAPLSQVEGIGLDGVELKFVHDQLVEHKDDGSLLGDLWRGMVDDVFGPVAKKA